MRGEHSSGKGSARRLRLITCEENDLRWELLDKKTTPGRKEAIKKRLEEIKNET